MLVNDWSFSRQVLSSCISVDRRSTSLQKMDPVVSTQMDGRPPSILIGKLLHLFLEMALDDPWFMVSAGTISVIVCTLASYSLNLSHLCKSAIYRSAYWDRFFIWDSHGQQHGSCCSLHVESISDFVWEQTILEVPVTGVSTCNIAGRHCFKFLTTNV